jgi:hypothetical protein
MPKKIKQTTQKSIKKNLLAQIEEKLSESLKEFSKKLSDKKYKKSIHKAGKILSKSIAVKPVRVDSKTKVKKSKKVVAEVKTEAGS